MHRLVWILLTHIAALVRCHNVAESLPRRANLGLVGYGIPMYRPTCAFACHHVLASTRLSCSTSPHKRHDDDDQYLTSPECFATDDAFLLSLAFCLQTQCNSTMSWRLDRFWASNVVGRRQGQPLPHLSFPDALSQLDALDPQRLPTVNIRGTLDTTSSVASIDWQLAYDSFEDMAVTERNHSRAGIGLLCGVIVLPILVNLLRLLAVQHGLQRHVVSKIRYAALWKRRHAVPLPFDVGILPTKGQAIFILYLLILNLIFLSVGYRVSPHNVDRLPAGERLMKYVSNRAGVLSFANLSIMMLCSARHNLAVRFAKWSYSTMLLYHRWAAYICIAEAGLHSVIWTYRHWSVLACQFTRAYWNWGNLATLGMCSLLPLSCLPIRKRAYELFLNTHIALSAVILIGLYYHIYCEFEHEWGYENWVYLATFLWLVDRICRICAVARNGVKSAKITYLDDDYARLVIPGIKAAGHAYIYFPSLAWPLWQNHPFSIAASVHEKSLDGFKLTYMEPEDLETLVSEQEHNVFGGDDDASNKSVNGGSEGKDMSVELDDGHRSRSLSPASEISIPLLDDQEESRLNGPRRQPDVKSTKPFHSIDSPLASGATIYIRRQHGITARLFKDRPQRLNVLVEGPYRPLPVPNLPTSPNLVCIAGGVGIATVLPALAGHALVGHSALYWSSRSRALVEAVPLNALQRAGVRILVKVQERWDVNNVVRQEALQSNSDGDTIVLVSGPNEMADEVRAAVVKINSGSSEGKDRKGPVRLIEECFSW